MNQPGLNQGANLKYCFVSLLILSTWLSSFTLHAKGSNSSVAICDSKMSPFAKLFCTPTLDPAYLENNIERYWKQNEEKKSELTNEFNRILSGFESCSFYDKQNLLLNNIRDLMPNIKNVTVYTKKLEHLATTNSQSRFGASNLPYKILINTEYPQSSNPDINSVFLLHEGLEAIGIKDEWYQVSATLWATPRICHKVTNKSTPYKGSFLKSTTFIKELLNLLSSKLARGHSTETSIDKLSGLQFADGGPTGIGGGGDPISAFFTASLYEQALYADLLQNNNIELNNSQWFTLIKSLKAISMPALNWLINNKGASPERYLDFINFTHQELQKNTKQQNKKNIRENAVYLAEFGDTDILYLDMQLLHWYLNNEVEYMERTRYFIEIMTLIFNNH